MGRRAVISVLVPVYNLENRIEACLAALQASRFPDFEVLCLDDGSTDATPALLDAAAARDPRFRVFHLPHRGVSAARNFGLDHAVGDYLTFVDGDDQLHCCFLGALLDAARRTGAAVVELVRRGIKPSDVMTAAAFQNAVTLLASIGGSLNALLHLPAIASELGLEVTWAQVAETTSRVPLVTNITPNGDMSCVNLYKAGGIPAVMKTIERDLDTSVMTINGKTLAENLAEDIKIDRSVIRTQDDPASVANGIQVLYGNLAPEGTLVKTSAVPADQHTFEGPAMCFNSEEECFAAYNADQIKPGTAVIIRYEGPKGGPGMKELHRVTEIMKGIPGSAVITDGRFSGASGGLSVGYLCPEAAEGGPIALIQDGDIVHIDLASNAISFDVSDEELEARRAAWTPVVHDIKGKVLRRYLKEVGPAKDGALLGC